MVDAPRKALWLGIISALSTFGVSAASATAMPAQDAAADEVIVAVVGGTSFGDPASFGKGLVEEEGDFTVQTVAGESPPIYRMRFKGVPFYYVRMHGREAAVDGEPTGWQFVKTWLALYDLGVKVAFGGATGGSINTGYDFDDLVIVDDLIVVGNQRPQSILRAVAARHTGIAERSRDYFATFDRPFCPQIRDLLIQVADERYPGRVHRTGTMVQDDPGRFETPAEIRMMRTWGADFVTHNVGTEAVYARQLGIRFAVLNSVSNPAMGVRPFDYEDMRNAVARITAGAVPVVLESIARVPALDLSHEPLCDGERKLGSYTGKSVQ